MAPPTVDPTNVIIAMIEALSLTVSIILAAPLDRKLESTHHWLQGLLEDAPSICEVLPKGVVPGEDKGQKAPGEDRGQTVPGKDEGQNAPGEGNRTGEQGTKSLSEQKGKHREPTARSRESVAEEYQKLIHQYDFSILLLWLSQADRF